MPLLQHVVRYEARYLPGAYELDLVRHLWESVSMAMWHDDEGAECAACLDE